MSERRVIVYLPSGTGNAGLTGWDELDVAESGCIEWHEGGPEVWER
ncbi:hypothetical protein [Streptomyces sp. BK340]|nr:hypothetical protein [Streptomyces sp. BK340]TVZ90538.1 hypothetical protein FB157_111197 [Streptomyces sp. BK340]